MIHPSTAHGHAKAASPWRGAVMAVWIALIGTAIVPPYSHAEPVEPTGVFELEIRTIEASELLQGDAPGVDRSIDARIEDLRSQLERLHYRNFRLMAAQRERVLPRRKTIFPLAHGHQLAVKPLYIDGNRVGVWMRWVDGSGAEVLDTRMHLTCGESLITGTDRDADQGVVVAIKPSNVQRAAK